MILGEQHYFVWKNASQSTKWLYFPKTWGAWPLCPTATPMAGRLWIVQEIHVECYDFRVLVFSVKLFIKCFWENLHDAQQKPEAKHYDPIAQPKRPWPSRNKLAQIFAGALYQFQLFDADRYLTSCQSRRHGGDWELSPPQTILRRPQFETWNTINQLRFCQFLECQAPPHKPKAPPETQSTPIENFLATVLRHILL